MEDPCKKCLVQVTCWQECDDKKNYSRLLADAVKGFQPYVFIPGPLKKQYIYYLDLTNKHMVSKRKIYNRAQTMLDQNKNI